MPLIATPPYISACCQLPMWNIAKWPSGAYSGLAGDGVEVVGGRCGGNRDVTEHSTARHSACQKSVIVCGVQALADSRPS